MAAVRIEDILSKVESCGDPSATGRLRRVLNTRALKLQG